MKLLELINAVCDDGSTGTNKDRTYVNLTQSHIFYNFLQRPNQTTAKCVQLIGDWYDTLQNRLGKFFHGTTYMVVIIKERTGTRDEPNVLKDISLTGPKDHCLKFVDLNISLVTNTNEDSTESIIRCH